MLYGWCMIKGEQFQLVYWYFPMSQMIPSTRWSMLKQWMLSDGKLDSITVEEKFVRWCEQLRTDNYVTVLHKHLHNNGISSPLVFSCFLTTTTNLPYHSRSSHSSKVTKLQLYKIYGRSKEAKALWSPSAKETSPNRNRVLSHIPLLSFSKFKISKEMTLN